MRMIVALVILIVVVTALPFYLKRKKAKENKAPDLIGSNFFPNDLHVGKICKLDKTLKHIYKDVFIELPDSHLMVEKFNSMHYKGNHFEEVIFGRFNGKRYTLLHDDTEGDTYFLHHLMTQDYDAENSPMSDDVVTLEESSKKYQYNDVSGLLRVTINRDGSQRPSLVRMYSRKSSDDSEEFLFLVQYDVGEVEFYVGIMLSNIHQLTTI